MRDSRVYVDTHTRRLTVLLEAMPAIDDLVHASVGEDICTDDVVSSTNGQMKGNHGNGLAMTALDEHHHNGLALR